MLRVHVMPLCVDVVLEAAAEPGEVDGGLDTRILPWAVQG